MVKKCSHCGSENDDGCIFCYECGTEMNTEIMVLSTQKTIPKSSDEPVKVNVDWGSFVNYFYGVLRVILFFFILLVIGIFFEEFVL